ncbi:MAG: type II toxin-antitoxin system Phd/YefM family antitoxin [Rhodospirillales bacterium]
MKRWPVQDAKAKFSELLDTCLSEGPQMVTRRGAEAAVLVPADVWRRMQARAPRSLNHCCWPTNRAPELEIPPRTPWIDRPPVDFD